MGILFLWSFYPQAVWSQGTAFADRKTVLVLDPGHGGQDTGAGGAGGLLRDALSELSGDAGCRIMGAPLPVLSAADMPAVLIEVGGLTSPAEEEMLSSPDHIASLADAICRGLKAI